LEYIIILPTVTHTFPGKYFPTSEKKNIFIEPTKLIFLPTDWSKKNVGAGSRKKPVESNPTLSRIDQILCDEKEMLSADTD